MNCGWLYNDVDDPGTGDGVGMAVGGRYGVLLREADEIFPEAATPDGVTDVLVGCATGSGIADAEFDVRLVSRVPYSVFSAGAMLLLDRLLNWDT